MRLQSIELTNFRQFKDEKIQFAIDKNQNVTLIMGDNGSGKTSLAQAFFWCFYGTNSFQDKILLNRFVANNMIPNQKEMVCVRVYLEHKQEEYCVVRQQEYTKQYNDSLKPQNSILAISKKDKNGNRMWLGTGKTESLKNIELTNTINDIMPQDLSKYFFFDGEKIETLSKEISSGRKSNNFVEAVNSLTGLKATRNALNHLNPKLKGSVIGKLEDEYIGGSDRKIAELTEEIKRLKSEWQSADDDINSADESIKSNDLYIEELENKIKTYAEAENLQRTKTNRQNELKEHKRRKYQSLSRIYDNLNRDIQYKMTLIGPNRDDFYFLLGDKNLSLYGSQGQIRSAVLALKLSEVKLFNNITGDTPILLLDDMFSELDINKRNNILKYLDRNIQTIITTTDIKNINEKIKEKANVYEIKEGKIISREIISKQEGD